MKKKSQFKAAWWLKNAHLQTIWPTVTRSKIELDLRRERFELTDGDFLDIDWLGEDQRKPIVVVLHGLGGSVESPYVPGMLQAIQESGWRAALMHFRGASEEHNRMARAYHAGETTDLAEFIQSIRRREPDTEIACVGYSLGGNVLLKWLGETGERNPLTAAIAVSVPFEFHKVIQRFNKGFSKFYSKYLLQQLRGEVVDKFENTYAPIDVEKLKKASSFIEFDESYTAPLHGFDSPYDYYQRASSRQYLKDICVPTLIIHAKDDPFMTPDSVPDESDIADCVTLEISETGGHVGFVTGNWPWQAEYWLDKRIPEFFKKHLVSVDEASLDEARLDVE
jgi:predicted alpha/beta-fold hydrolase